MKNCLKFGCNCCLNLKVLIEASLYYFEEDLNYFFRLILNRLMF